MKEISLTQGKVALVDDADYEWLTQWRWHASVRGDGRVYAVRNTTQGEVRGPQQKVWMHRVVLRPAVHLLIDHKDGDGLNNQRHNLRTATTSQNGCNRRMGTNNTSGYRGVCRTGALGKPWYTHIKYQGRVITLGRFSTAELAAVAYDDAARKYHGEFAKLNFPLTHHE